jgi:hypothetical protein
MCHSIVQRESTVQVETWKVLLVHQDPMPMERITLSAQTVSPDTTVHLWLQSQTQQRLLRGKIAQLVMSVTKLHFLSPNLATLDTTKPQLTVQTLALSVLRVLFAQVKELSHLWLAQMVSDASTLSLVTFCQCFAQMVSSATQVMLALNPLSPSVQPDTIASMEPSINASRGTFALRDHQLPLHPTVPLVFCVPKEATVLLDQPRSPQMMAQRLTQESLAAQQEPTCPTRELQL